HLKAGETRSEEFELAAHELGFYDRHGKFIVEPGAFQVFINGGGEEGVSGSFICGPGPSAQKRRVLSKHVQ
ncbi:MAG: fibronectin type III-like domain-contianing protein, partial [Armatimonadota bacterium]